MWVPVERGTVGQRMACPVELGQLVSLQPRPFVKGTAVTISKPPLLTTLGLMDDKDARAQGYRFGLAEARRAWEAVWGRWAEDREAWKLIFMLGDYASMFRGEQERYLIAKMGGGRSYTTEPERGAHGEGAVPRAQQAGFARAARDHREAEAEQALRGALRRIEAEIKELSRHRTSLPAEALSDLQWLERRAARMKARLNGRAAPA
jgi:hypothetical protein